MAFPSAWGAPRGNSPRSPSGPESNGGRRPMCAEITAWPWRRRWIDPMPQALQRPHLHLGRLGDGEAVAQRQAEGLGLDLENVALLGLDPVAERERRGAEEMHMH